MFPAPIDMAEDGFVANFASSIYGRVGGKFIVERRAGREGGGI